MTTTTTIPDVPPPSGAHTLSTWEEWGGDYRLVWGTDRPVPASIISLAPHAVQLRDGSIDDGAVAEPPGIAVEEVGPTAAVASTSASLSKGLGTWRGRFSMRPTSSTDGRHDDHNNASQRSGDRLHALVYRRGWTPERFLPRRPDMLGTRRLPRTRPRHQGG
jgi:hypothetical protein